ncbi:MAG: MFS transporter [Actinobacteria bacterium]|nr:MFS transporter [Actinomycetota bacterium]
MSSTTSTMDSGTGGAQSSSPKGRFRFIIDRSMDIYPDTAPRYTYLGITVAITIVLYYLYFVEGAVTPLMLPYYHMSFLYFMTLVVIGNAAAAVTALVGGLSDKIGRVNLTIYGVLAVALLQLLAIPNIHSELGFGIAYTAIGFAEGIVLVSTPALIRDFSPQMGRASAMGFWTLGPVIGSLAATLVAEHTLAHLHPWQDQFIISGIVALVIFIVAFVGLRELSPGLRDQLMVSEKERALVQARAKGIDIEKSLKSPLRTMFKWDLIVSAFGISTFLLIYYAAVTVFTLYFVVVFGQSTANANGIDTWYWAFDAIALVVMGILSDKLRVRKPFMLVGAIGMIVATYIFLSKVHSPATGYYTLVWIVVFIGIFDAMAYAPWMAAYTEAVEEKNPALSATGLAVWGWVLRIVIAASFLVMPRVISTASTLVDNQTSATTLQTLKSASPYVTNHKPAPPDVLAALKATGEPYGKALAAYLATPESVNTVSTLQALEVAAPYATAKKPAPATVVTDLKATHEPYSLALADYISSGYNFAAVPHPLFNQLLGLINFSPAAASVQAGKPVSAATVASIKKYSPQLAVLLNNEKRIAVAQPGVFNQLQGLNYFSPAAAGVQAGKPVSAATVASIKKYSPQLAVLLSVEKKVIPAQKHSPNQWEVWWWVCLGGQVLFLILLFTIKGRWSPKAARRDFEEYQKTIDKELAALASSHTTS